MTSVERTSEQRYSVDRKSRELAEYFLGENRLEADYKALAQQIQDVAESYCIALDQEASDQTDETDPYEAAGESRFGLPGGGTSL